jgi:CO/xanthine dehydrogenase FAD-binding subunit
MRGHTPSYDLTVATSLADALAQLALPAAAPDSPDAPGTLGVRPRLFAGGTDLMVLYEAGKLPPGRYLSIARLPELHGIELTPEFVKIGAMSSYRDIRESALLHADFPMLAQAARESGAIAIQNRGTLGGNIMNASPAADSPPALLAYDAEVELRSVRGARWVRYASFHTGYKQTQAAPDELLTRIRLPRHGAGHGTWHHFYEKVGTRAYQAISKVCVAGFAYVDRGIIEGIRLAFGSVGPTPLLARHVMADLVGRPADASVTALAVAALAKDIAPIDDIRSSRGYRMRVAENLVKAFVRGLAP